MYSKLLCLIFFPLFFISCQGQTAETIKTIDANLFAQKLKATPNAQLLDVRTPDEFNIEHINNAVNVNWNGADFVSKANNYDKTKPVFVYCKVGGRSASAANKLAGMGFKEIYNLEGGIMKWNATGNGKQN